jgi:hypothetical protein
MKKEDLSEMEIKKKFHDYLQDYLMSDEGCISIEQAIKEVNKRWPRKQKVDKSLTKQFKKGLEDLKSGRIRRVA